MASTIIGQSATEFASAALRLLGQIDPGEGPTQQELADCKSALDMMLDSWQAEGDMIFTTTIQDFPLVNSKQTYTMGPGGDFDIDRPANIGNSASIVILTNPLQPIEYVIPIFTTQEWQNKVPVKGVQGNLPTLVYDDGGFPLRSLSFWPIPGDTIKARFYVWQLLSRFADLTTRYAFPPAYAEAIKYNLAVRMAPEFQVQVSPELAMLSVESLGRVKASNPDDTQLRSDIAGGGLTGSRWRAEMFGIPSF